MIKLTRALASLVAIYALATPVSGQSAPTSSQEVIGQAQGAYYNLRRQGFSGFKAAIEPNWEVILGHTATQENLKVFRALQFSMVVDATGAVTVSHAVADAQKASVEPYIRQIHGNVQRLVAAFFSMWARFMVGSPFPENESQIKIDNSGKEYRLSYTTEATNIILTMTNDLVITDWKLTGPRSKQTIRPLFEKTSEGLLLNGYKSFFEPVGDGIKTALDFTIEYQNVGGMKLPHRIEIRGLHGSEPVEAELRFDQYVLNSRQVN